MNRSIWEALKAVFKDQRGFGIGEAIAGVALSAGLGATAADALGTAAVGALTGGGISAITGGNIGKGALFGGLGGGAGSLFGSAIGGAGAGLSGITNAISGAPNSIVDSISGGLGDLQNSFAGTDLGNALGISPTDLSDAVSGDLSAGSALQGASGIGDAASTASGDLTSGGGMSFGTPGAAPISSTAGLADPNVTSALTSGGGASPGTAAWSPYDSNTSFLNGGASSATAGMGNTAETIGAAARSPGSPLSLSGIGSGITKNPISAGLTLLQAIQSSQPNSNQQLYAQQQAANAAQDKAFQSATTSAPGTYTQQQLTPEQWANYAYGTGNKNLVSFQGNSNAPALAAGGQVRRYDDGGSVYAGDDILGGTGGIDPSILAAIGGNSPTQQPTNSSMSLMNAISGNSQQPRSPSSPLSPSGIASGVSRNPIAGLLAILQAIQSSKPNFNQQIYGQQQAQNAAQNALFQKATQSAPGVYTQTQPGMSPQDYVNYATGAGNKQLVNFQGNSAASPFASGGQVPDNSQAYLSNALYDNVLVPPSGGPAAPTNIPMMASGGLEQTGLNAPGLNSISGLLQQLAQGPVMPQLYGTQPVAQTSHSSASDSSPSGMAKGGLMGALHGSQPAMQQPQPGGPTATPMSTGTLFAGTGGGQSDNINAGNAIVSPGEFVHRAAVTSAAGDGNPTEGAKRLNEFGENLLKDYATKITSAKGKNPPKNSNIAKFMPKRTRKGSAPKQNTKPPVE